MATEYVGLKPSQQVYAKKNLLYSEMELLNTLKHHQRYKVLRNQELALKKLLKKSMTELREELKNLDSFLPKTKHSKFQAVEISRTQKKRTDLEEEIDEIKRKISELQ